MASVKQPGWDGQQWVEFYMDDHLNDELNGIQKRIEEEDEDWFVAVDGEEGVGKSVFAFQIAKKLDPTFELSRVVFTPKDFQDTVIKASKGQAIVFDEAFRGLSSRGALSEVNKLLVGLMMECRQKNLFVIIVLPSFFLLDKYVALSRAKGLFHVYRPRHGEYRRKRGFWMYFNRERKKFLYLWGKKDLSYDKPKANFGGRFMNIYTIPETPYREKKYHALQASTRVTRAEAYLDQRNTLLWFLNREMKVTTTGLSNRLREIGWEIDQSTISDCIVKKEAELQQRGHIL